MTTTPGQDAQQLSEAVTASWLRFLDIHEPLRPVLYRYCRSLTRSPWDADDLVQDTMARAFVTLGCMREAPPNPRAWLFRIASNLWIDRVRREREEPGAVPEKATWPEPRAAREAAGTLIARLSPQERTAVVLKEAFDLSLEEIAETLSTSVGAVKAALHRGEPILLHWYAHEDGQAVRGLTRVETSGDRLSRVRNYFYTPDVIAEICGELVVPFRLNGYRYWPAP